MKREKTVSCTLTTEEYEALSILVAKRIVKEKRHVTVSTYLRELVQKHLNGTKNVSSPSVDTESTQDTKQEVTNIEQKNKWKEFNLDGIYDDP